MGSILPVTTQSYWRLEEAIIKIPVDEPVQWNVARVLNPAHFDMRPCFFATCSFHFVSTAWLIAKSSHQYRRTAWGLEQRPDSEGKTGSSRMALKQLWELESGRVATMMNRASKPGSSQDGEIRNVIQWKNPLRRFPTIWLKPTKNDAVKQTTKTQHGYPRAFFCQDAPVTTEAGGMRQKLVWACWKRSDFACVPSSHVQYDSKSWELPNYKLWWLPQNLRIFYCISMYQDCISVRFSQLFRQFHHPPHKCGETLALDKLRGCWNKGGGLAREGWNGRHAFAICSCRITDRKDKLQQKTNKGAATPSDFASYRSSDMNGHLASLRPRLFCEVILVSFYMKGNETDIM